MTSENKSSQISVVLVWNFLLVFFELIVLGLIEAYFLIHSLDHFTTTTLEQHLNSHEKSLERMLFSMSNAVADDISQGLIETGYFDRIRIKDDFGNIMVDVTHNIQPTFYSALAHTVFGVDTVKEIYREIPTPFQTEGELFVRANLTSLTDSLMREIFARSLLFIIISLCLSLGGTTLLIRKIHKGAKALEQLATDISAHDEEGLNKKRNFHFAEFEFLSDHLSNSFQNVIETNAQLSTAIQERQDTEETYRLTLQSLKLYSKLIDTDGRVLFSNFDGMKNTAFKAAFSSYQPDLLHYLNKLKHLGYETKLLAQIHKFTETISETLKVQIVEGENSWFVQMSRLNDGRVLLTCSNVSEVRQNDSQRFHREKIEALGRISSNVAHEFNNMLNIMINSIETARNLDGLDKTTTDLLDTAMIAGQRANGVVTRLQQLSKDQALNCEYLELQSWLKNSVPLMRAIIGPQTKISIACDGPTTVLADASALDAIVINLCKNAADAMHSSGHIRINIQPYSFNETETPDLNPLKQYVTLTFQDTGPGVPKNLQNKIFEPYFTTKDNHMGTGLGLPEARNMTQKMNGEIRYNAQNPNGAEFVIYLEKGEAHNIARHYKTQSKKKMAPKPLSILIVEDEMLLSRLWENYLIPMGINVACALTLHQARQYLEDKKTPFDIAILDNTLPDGFGADLLEDIRSKNPECRCISISGEQEIQNSSLYDAHIQKPVRLSVLRDLILSDGSAQKLRNLTQAL